MKSAQEDLAELGVGLHELEERFLIELDDFAILPRAHREEDRPAREQIDFARELTRTGHGHDAFQPADASHDFQPAAPHDEEPFGWLPAFDDHLVGPHAAVVPASFDPRDLWRRQYRKHLRRFRIGGIEGRRQCRVDGHG